MINSNTIQFLKLLGNPYAKLSILGEEDELGISENNSPVIEMVENSTTSNSNIKTQIELFPGSQYPNRNSISKGDFETVCRRIFNKYTPGDPKSNVLKAPYREFISKHHNRSGEDRFKILKHLKKYDLSSLGNCKPHFNRERKSYLLKKLDSISRSIEK